MRITGAYGMEQATAVPMTDEQKTQAEEILAKYDPENMTPEDWEAMREEFEQAGIRPGRQMMQMMQEAGFPRPPRPERPAAEQADAPQGNAYGAKKGELWELYQQFQSGEITEDEFLEQFRSSPITGRLINYLS